MPPSSSVVDFRGLLGALKAEDVRFIVVGGAAATAHGSARVTLDLDIVYDRAADNLERLVRALAPTQPYLRGAPPGLPFKWDTRTLARGLNFTLTTTHGDIDLLGEITGGGGYAQLLPRSMKIEAFGHEHFCLDLETLIATKRAAGRVKDFDAVAELEALREELQRPGDI